MKTTGKLIIFVFTLLAVVASTYAQSPREELKQMVEQLQKSPNDNALREKIIKLATSIKPAPAIPEEAREPFVMGATVLKKASDPAGASKAVDLFTQALNIAPWFADAYYNRALAREAAGQFEPAIDDLKLYLEFKLTDNERREAQDKIYSLKADAQLALSKKAEQDKVASAEATEKVRRAQRLQGTWIENDPDIASYYHMQAVGDTVRFSSNGYISIKTGESTSVSPGHYGEFRLKSESGEFKGVYVEGTQRGACAGRESPSRAILSENGLEMTVTTTVLYDLVTHLNPGGWTDTDRNTCTYSPKPEWRFVMRKQK